jgi:hypothetical protein
MSFVGWEGLTARSLQPPVYHSSREDRRRLSAQSLAAPLGIRSLADSASLDQSLNCRRIADRNIESLTYLRPFDYVGISSNNRTALKRNAVLIGTLHGVVLSNFLISRGCRL